MARGFYAGVRFKRRWFQVLEAVGFYAFGQNVTRGDWSRLQEMTTWDQSHLRIPFTILVTFKVP